MKVTTTCLTLMLSAKAISISTGDDPTSHAAIDILEFSNGCLCCSIKNSGVAAIERLLQLKGAYDYILLETTGLADPGESSMSCNYHVNFTNARQAPIASMFWQNEEFSSISQHEM
jgi:G3E family GTPase